MAGPDPRPNVEAAEILARMEPGRLDSLWLEILASNYGRKLLNSWDLTLDETFQYRPAMAGMAEDVVRWANRLVCLTSPASFECAEYMLCGLLATGQSALCQALRTQGKDVRALLDELTEELWRDPIRSLTCTIGILRLTGKAGINLTRASVWRYVPRLRLE